MHDDGLSGDGVAGDGLYSAFLPAQPNNTVVEFYIRATDAQGLTRTWPAPAMAAPDGAGPTGQVANALYQVDDTTYNPTNNQPLYKLIMIENERVELANIPPSGDRNTDAEMNGTFVSLDGAGTELHYTVGFRNRGHGTRAGNALGIPNYRVGFRSDDLWKGVSALNINSQSVPIQHLGSLLARKAGVAGANTIPAQVRVNNANRASSGSPMFGSYAANEVQGGDWAAAHFPFDPNGNVYRAIRDIPPPDFSYRGENKLAYENTWFKQSNLSEDDWTDLIGMLRVVGINNATSFTTDNVRQVVNVEQWMRHLALMNLFGNNETGLNTGYNDDYFMYRGVNDPRFILTYYDLDTILGEGGSLPPNAGLFTATADLGSGQAFERFMNWPDFQPIYFRTLKEMLDTAFAKPNFDTMVDQALGSYVQSDTIVNIKSWMDSRRSFVLSQLPAITNSAPPVAAVSGAPRSPTPLTSATLAVGGPGVATYRFKLNGGSFGPETPLSTNIVLTGLANGTNILAVIARGTNGVWQDATNATIRSWIVNTTWPSVRLNEVLAHNVAAVNHSGSFPDVVELFNEGGGTVDLSGLRLTDDPASPNKFTFPAVTTLASGAFLVVYADNPDGSPGLHLGFSLDQDGEGVYLLDRATNGSTVLDSVVFGLQLADLSIGRVAGGDWALTQPSFGSANVAKPVGDTHNLKINEWLAAGLNPNPDDFIELYNAGPLPVALGGLHLTDQPIGAPALHTIPALSFIAGGLFQNFFADGTAHRAGHVNFKLALEQGEIGLTAADGSILDCIIYGPQEPGVSSGRCPDGTMGYKSLSIPTPGAPNACPFVPPAPQSVFFTTISNVWKYDQSGADLGTAWRGATYNDASWPSGAALLGFDTGTLPEPFRTTFTLSNTKTTFYFRAYFNVASNLNVSSLQMRHIIDDGAVVYLNSNEVHRFNMAGGAVFATTLASTSVVDAAYSGPFNLALANLVPGTNVIAVEVHQSSTNSTDLTFGLELTGIIVTNSPLLAGVVINEVLANNATLEEPDGLKPDWVEIYNPSSSAVDLAGLSLTDSTLTPQRWVFPAGSILPALGFRKVRLDPDSPSSATNTGFGLKANGGAVYLFNRPADGGTVASS
ncbi:MAG TPA: lamin tail domain-containing protein, partial [Verrucomicrobiae bacterium]